MACISQAILWFPEPKVLRSTLPGRSPGLHLGFSFLSLGTPPPQYQTLVMSRERLWLFCGSDNSCHTLKELHHENCFYSSIVWVSRRVGSKSVFACVCRREGGGRLRGREVEGGWEEWGFVCTGCCALSKLIPPSQWIQRVQT